MFSVLHAAPAANARRITVTFERDSVCAGDDVLAPNAELFGLQDGARIGDLLTARRLDAYLPHVTDSEVRWSAVLDGRQIATVWIADAPRAARVEIVEDAVLRDGCHVYFRKVQAHRLHREAP